MQNRANIPPTLILKLEKDRIYYNNQSYLHVRNTNLPSGISFKTGTYWEIKIINYEIPTGHIEASIKFYSKKPLSFYSQPQYDISIKRIKFETLDDFWLSASVDRKSVVQLQGQRKKTKPELDLNDSADKTMLKIDLRIPIKSLSFHQGFVTFEKFISDLATNVTVQINNSCINPQFDAIKNYLIKALKTKLINVNLKIDVERGDFGVVKNYNILEAQSPEINRINNKLIEGIEIDYFLKLISEFPVNNESPGTLSTVEDFITKNSTNFVGKLSSNPTTFLKKLLNRKKSIHEEQLSHLSSLTKIDIFILKIYPRPFSFLFLIEGKSHYHFVLETYNDELATYLWHVEKDIKKLKIKFQEIEKLIQAFGNSQRKVYRTSKPIDFSIVDHDYKDKENGFKKWLAKLNEKIT